MALTKKNDINDKHNSFIFVQNKRNTNMLYRNIWQLLSYSFPTMDRDLHNVIKLNFYLFLISFLNHWFLFIFSQCSVLNVSYNTFHVYELSRNNQGSNVHVKTECIITLSFAWFVEYLLCIYFQELKMSILIPFLPKYDLFVKKKGAVV